MLFRFHLFEVPAGACNQQLWRQETYPPDTSMGTERRECREGAPGNQKKKSQGNRGLYKLGRALDTRGAESRRPEYEGCLCPRGGEPRGVNKCAKHFNCSGAAQADLTSWRRTSWRIDGQDSGAGRARRTRPPPHTRAEPRFLAAPVGGAI